LTVSDPNDPREREAERVAAAVVGTSARPGAASPVGIARQSTSAGGPSPLGEGLQREIQSLRGGGKPLPASERSFFEPRLGADLGDVRVHDGGRADELARSIDAEAFTVGRDVAFRRGNYPPATDADRELLAHELTHVVQADAGAGGNVATVRRRVREDNVSCADYPRDYPIFDVIGTENPVEEIREADRHAIELLDTTIGRLRGAMHQVRAQEGHVVPNIVPKFMGDALVYNFGLDPNDRGIWAEDGTVPILLERFETTRDVLEGGQLEYTCFGGKCYDKSATAYMDPSGARPAFRIHLCRPWWHHLSLEEQASTLAHEVLHIYYWDFLRHSEELGDAEAYEQFIEDVVNRRERH